MILLLPVAFIMMYQYIRCKIYCSKSKHCTLNLCQHKGVCPEALFYAIVAFQAVVLLVTNLLSVFCLLTKWADGIAWIIVICVFAFLYGKNSAEIPFAKNSKKGPHNSGENKGFRGTTLMFLMLLILTVLALVLLFGTIFTVPYNYDSMTYHLARIGYWIDHESVAHYTTNIDRQLYSPVLCEYNLLHMMLLSGNDTFVNFLQYFCMFGAAYFIYHSIKKLGTNSLYSLFGAFIFMMMPLTISQSITTQNDLFAALIFILFVYKLIDVVSWEKIVLDRKQILNIVSLGLLVSYAYIAKTSVCASMVMFMPWLLIGRIRKKDSVKKLFQSVGIAIVAILLPMSETLIRTFLSSGSLMTSTASGNIMVATKNVKYILVNILKNFSMLITQNYFRPLNGFIYRIAIGTGQKLQVEVNHEAIAFHGFDFLHHMNMGEDMYSHDKTPSAFVAYLAVLAGVVLIVLLLKVLWDKVIKKQKPTQEEAESIFMTVGFGISAWLSLGFIMALLRWQPWGTRLMYPALSVTVIMSAHLLYVVLQKTKQTIGNFILGVFIVLTTMLAIPSVTYNLQPAISFVKDGCENRIHQYFRANYRQDGYFELVNRARSDEAEDIGLIISGDGFDYPLWVMLRKEYPEGRLRHLIKEEARNPSKKAPDCIFMIERDVFEVGETYTYAGEIYTCKYKNDITGDCYLQR